MHGLSNNPSTTVLRRTSLSFQLSSSLPLVFSHTVVRQQRHPSTSTQDDLGDCLPHLVESLKVLRSPPRPFLTADVTLRDGPVPKDSRDHFPRLLVPHTRTKNSGDPYTPTPPPVPPPCRSFGRFVSQRGVGPETGTRESTRVTETSRDGPYTGPRPAPLSVAMTGDPFVPGVGRTVGLHTDRSVTTKEEVT